MNQNTVVILVIAIAVVAVSVAGFFYSRRRRSRLLREHFGPEYDRVLGQEKSVSRTENVLEFREQAREAFPIRALSRSEQVEFANQWNAVQSRFVDEPQQAVRQADGLLTEVMKARGYPVANFEQRAELISVDHPKLVQNYRAAHEIVHRQGQGQLTTEDLRKAVIHYRSLFDELLNDSIITEKLEKKEAHA